MRPGKTLRIELGAGRFAREAHVAGDDTNAPPLTDGRRGRGRAQQAPAHLQSEEPVGFVARLHGSVEAHSGVARRRKRQGRIALQLFERARADHVPLLHQHHLVGEALDFRHVVRDVDDRQIEVIAQPLEERQDLVLGRAVERRERLVHQEKLRLRQERAPDRHALTLAA